VSVLQYLLLRDEFQNNFDAFIMILGVYFIEVTIAESVIYPSLKIIADNVRKNDDFYRFFAMNRF